MEFEILRSELLYSTEMIRSLVSGISPEKARVKPSDDSWSILEVICHLHDEEREDFREHLDFILHRQGEEYHRIDPQAWVVERHYNDQDFEAVREKFLAERRTSLAWLAGIRNVDWSTTYKSEWGEMSAGVMLASWVAHDNLHIRQLVELRRKWIEKITGPYEIAYAGDW